jgi:hypothetical protein
VHNKNYKQLTFILYDGIKNSVFASQVLQPILNLLKEDNKLEITLVTFEKNKPSNDFLLKTIPAHNRLHFVLCRKLPFIGKTSLRFAVYQFKNLLKLIPSQKIIARGPLAGWIALKAIKRFKKNINLKIQARGLCAQEYRFAYQNVKQNMLKKFFRKFIYHRLEVIEKETYKEQKRFTPAIKIESVSPALKNYLATTFKCNHSSICIANKDIPEKINPAKIKEWFNEIRNQLNIPKDYFVYCYSGSAKPWQCLPESIEHFFEQYKKDQKKFLLILSQDKKEIEKIVSKYKIPETNYKLICVQPSELTKYLAACNAGFLFRDNDIINWVSRPTKMLEYEAVGLKIIHNNTIAWLEDQT